MSDQTHTRSDAGALDDDFEWVNAWATSMRPAAPASPSAGPRAAQRTETPRPEAPRQDRAPAQRGGKETSAPADRAVRVPKPSPVAPTANDHAVSPLDGDHAIAMMSEPVATPPANRRAGRWTSLFRLASRASTPEADAARDLFVLDAPDVPAPSADAHDGAQSRSATARDAYQLARDMVEIVLRRDQLATMPLGPRFDRPARSRTSEYVPILVGAVLAFTSLIVFGAAASFVSLR